MSKLVKAKIRFDNDTNNWIWYFGNWRWDGYAISNPFRCNECRKQLRKSGWGIVVKNSPITSNIPPIFCSKKCYQLYKLKE